ncbi:hypothetical protein [Siphonobacter sp.]|uniref:hypothetical protein n=1 Tax=Siphonobacter sp. TaxID=1869184 RepID=UPI003B3AD2E9
MNTEKFYYGEGGFIRFFSNGNVERVNPIEYYKNYEIKKRAILIKDSLKAENAFLTSFLKEDFFIKKAEEDIADFFDIFEQTKIHSNFLALLDATRKKDQERLLKGMSLNLNELMALIFKSFNNFGFLYSKYFFETLPAGLAGKKLPELLYLRDDGTIKKIGDTDLVDGELKNIIEHRKVIVSHFFEKDNFWHCFFLTYKSISGRETWKGGQAHFHYISSVFGISKEDFIESMRTGNYKSTSIHIDLVDHSE